MTKRILLVEPPFYRLHKNSYSMDRIPFGLAYLAGAILKDTLWDVKVYNADFIPSIGRKKISYLSGKGFENYVDGLNDLENEIWKEVRKLIEEYNPDVVGISIKSATFISSMNVAKIVKNVDPNIKVIVGGPHPTLAKKEIFANSFVDFVVVGEGEVTIAELLNSFDGGKNFNEVNGIIYRNDEDIIATSPRDFIYDLDGMAFPHSVAKNVLHDYDKYPINSFKYIFASRGCPYGCHFCGSKEMWTRKVRQRSVANVIEEIEGIIGLGIKGLHFDDDTFGISKKFILELSSQIIKHAPNISWSCEIRADLIDDETVIAMKNAGCETIQIGFESGNDKLLSLMGKGLTVAEINNACKTIKRHNIELQTFFLVGYPNETEEMLKDTVRVMKKSKSDKILYSIFTPYPYTALYEFCESKGLMKDDFDPTLYNHQSPLNCFSMYIKPERFRVLATKIERMIDRRNLINRVKTVVLFKGFPRLGEIVSEMFRRFQIKQLNNKYNTGKEIKVLETKTLP